MDWAHALSTAWLGNPWLVWGVGPVVSSALGFLLTAGILELVLQQRWLDEWLLCYASNSFAPRKQLLAATHSRLPFRKQLVGSMKLLCGSPGILSGVGLAVLMQLIGADARAWLPATAAAGAAQLLLLAIINDFGLYWGHRVQHESEFLWRFHAKHHAIDTPSPVSTLFIHPVDATLQGSLPIALAAVLVRPPPLLLYVFVAARVGENVVNHSGLDSRLVDIITLKMLPLRASIAHHDAHHKYSNHSRRARNYAESFTVWDALFGTTSPLAGVAACTAAAAAAKKA